MEALLEPSIFMLGKRTFLIPRKSALLEEATGDAAYALNLKEKLCAKKPKQQFLKVKNDIITLTEVSRLEFSNRCQWIQSIRKFTLKCLKFRFGKQKKALGNGWLNAVHEDDKELLFEKLEKCNFKTGTFLVQYPFCSPRWFC